MGGHFHTHIIPRLQKVIDGADEGGITKAVGRRGSPKQEKGKFWEE
jgi:adenine-specific DNA-methyltransferase